MSEDQKDNKKIDGRFILGLVMLVFLVLMYTLVKEFPLWIVGIPALFMGLDPKAIADLIRAIKGK